jgi:hypothetical protein
MWAASPTATARSQSSGEPTRVEVVNALRPIEPTVQRCMGDLREVARVQLTVSSAGRVTEVSVGPPFAGTPAATCMERALRRARLPRSESPSYVLSHPFRPAPIAGGAVTGPAAARQRQRRAAPAREVADDVAFAR